VPTTSPTAAGRAGREIRALTGARGIPVLLIALFHYHEWFGYPGAGWYDTIVSKGYIWVEFFFALSGFVLFYAYGYRFGSRLTSGAVSGFLAARISRLYPLQLATLLAVVILEIDRRIDGSRKLGVSFFEVPAFIGRTLGTFVGNLFMVQSWGLYDSLSWNAPAWFVSVEFFLCLVCPFLLWLVGARPGWRSMALGALSVGSLVTLVSASGRGLDMTAGWGMGRGLADFGIGLTLAALFGAARSRDGTGMARTTVAHTAAQVAALIAIMAALALSGPARTRGDLLVAAPIFSLVLLLAFDRGAIARALHARWLMKLGEWSFGIYMVHYFAMHALAILYQPQTPWAGPLVGLTGSVLFGALAHRFLEQPVGAVLRKKLTTAPGQ